VANPFTLPNQGKLRYQNDPIFRMASQGALQYARNLFSQQAQRPFMGRDIVNMFQGGGGGGGGGGNPAAGILADYLSKMRGDVNAASVADAASRDAAIKRLVISYGQVPDFSALGLDDKTAKIIQGALDQKTRDLAQKNTDEGTSVYARMFKDNQVANRRIPAMLAGRGLLRSGQTVSDLSDQAQGYKNQSFDALNAMLGEANNAIGAFAAAERQRQEQLASMELQAALAAAQQGYGDNWGDPSGPPGPPAGPNTGVSTRPATNVWKPPKGNVYLGLKAGNKVLVGPNSPFRRK